MIALVRSLDDAMADMIVPHCPQWTVAMTVSHMVGVPESIMSGDMDGVTSDEWTARQVERHLGESLGLLAELWEKQRSRFDVICSAIPEPMVSNFVFDQVTHEHDIRWAVGRPGNRDSAAVTVAASWIRTVHDPSLVVPDGLDDFEVLRSLSGRRSPDQLRRSGFDPAAVARSMERLPLSVPASTIGD